MPYKIATLASAAVMTNSEVQTSRATKALINAGNDGPQRMRPGRLDGADRSHSIPETAGDIVHRIPACRKGRLDL